MAAPATADIIELMQRGDVSGVSEFVRRGLEVTKEEREVLCTLSAKYLKDGWKFDESVSRQQVQCAAVVGTAVMPISKLNLISRWIGAIKDPDVAVDVLRTRDRKFRDKLAAAVTERTRGAWGIETVRRLVFLGLADRPESDLYTLALVTDPRSFDLTGEADTVFDVFRLNPDLLELEFWRLFEVEGGGDQSLARTQKYCIRGMGADSWHSAVVALAAAGLVDRERLLDATLSALESGFKQYRAGWYSELHTLLEPTAEEMSRRSVVYLRLAGSAIGPTVTMALAELTKLQTAGLLDPHLVIEYIEPALTTKAKGSATRALKLLEAAVGSNDREQLDEANRLAMVSLCHPAKDVQLAAVKVLSTWTPEADDQLAELARAASQACDPTTIAAVGSWLDTGDSPAIAPPRWERPKRRRLIPSEGDWIGSSPTLPPLPHPDDLLTRVVALMERGDDANEFEVLIAAMLTTPAGQTGSPRALATIERRAIKLEGQRSPSETDHIAKLVRCWLNEATEPSNWADQLNRLRPVAGWTPPPIWRLIDTRFDELADLLLSRLPYQLLATPTHVGGHLGPVEFANRFAEMCDRNQDPLEADLQVALLRLAPQPEHLTEALAVLTPVQHGEIERVRTWLKNWAADCDDDEIRVVKRRVDVVVREAEGKTYRVFKIDNAGSAGSCLEVAQNGLVAGGRFPIRYRSSLVPSASGTWSRAAAFALEGHTGTYISGPCDRELDFERFFDSKVPFGPSQHLALAMGLAAREKEIRGVATDLVIETMEDGRLDPQLLGNELGELTQHRVLITARWVAALEQAIQASPVCTGLGFDVLKAALLQTDPTDPNRILPLLEAVERATTVLGVAVEEPDVADVLRGLVGSTKSGRAAARLLAAGVPV